MENDRNFAIVEGYHECSYPPAQAYDAGFTQRSAVVLDTYRRDKQVAFFDCDLFLRILDAICRAIPHDSLAIEIGDGQELRSLQELSERYAAQSDDDRDAPVRAWLRQGNRPVAHIETEEWVFCGGPAPYHDSYTLSFYTSDNRAGEFRAICERVSKEIGATITGIHAGRAAKEPFTPLWKVPLEWPGIRPR